jgi:hypothetical protein
VQTALATKGQFQLFKNCTYNDSNSVGRRGGKIALGPLNNPVALNIEKIINTLGYKAAWYNSIQEIDDWVGNINYGRLDSDGLNSNICFGIFFDVFLPSAH